MDTCAFCEKIIIPSNLITTNDIVSYFKEHNINFTLNYTKSRFKIGNKYICFVCENELRNLIFYQEVCDCQECQEERENNERYRL